MINSLMKKMKKNKKGFTLIELIVVIAILAILAAIAVPSLFSTLTNSKIKADMSMAAQIGRSAEIYAVEVNNQAPTISLAAGAFVNDYLNGIVPMSQVVTTKTFTVTVAAGKATVTVDATDAGSGGVLYNAGVPVTFSDTVKAFYTGS